MKNSKFIVIENIVHFAATVREIKSLVNTKVELILDNMNDTYLEQILDILMSEYRNPNILLVLTFGNSNNITDAGVSLLAKAIKTGCLPERLSLDFDYFSSVITEAGAIQLASALASRKCPRGLGLDLGSNEIGLNGVIALLEPLQRGEGPEDFHLGLSFVFGSLETTPGSLRDNLKTQTFYHAITKPDLIQTYGDIISGLFGQGLMTGNFPNGFSLNLDSNHVTDAGLKSFANAIESGQCPHKFSLSLDAANRFSPTGVRYLAEALMSDHHLEDFSLSLEGLDTAYNGVHDTGAYMLASVIASDKSPAALTLGLSRAGITDDGAAVLINALGGRKNKKRISIDLDGNDIGIKTIRALADLLRSGQCPPGTTLTLRQLKLGPRSAEILADALKYAPENFTLNLDSNNFKNEGAAEFAKAFKNGGLPRNLTLDISYCKFDAHGIAVINEALAAYNCPPGFNLTLQEDGHMIIQELLRESKLLIAKNEIKHAAARSMTVLQGWSQPDSNLSMLNKDTVTLLNSYLYPDQSEIDKNKRPAGIVFANNVSSMFKSQRAARKQNENDRNTIPFSKP